MNDKPIGAAARMLAGPAQSKPAKRTMTEWYEAVDQITPYVVRISTPIGTGSGFLLSWASKTEICAVATAAHVVNHAHYWEQPIRIEHVSSGKSILLKQRRAIFIDSARDSATLIFERGELQLPSDPLELVPVGAFTKVGNRIGWLGFPAISTQMCFFRGCISAWIEAERSYLVDGVAINGVSGGPAFFLHDGVPTVLGVVSAYMPNRQSGEVLPGLAVVRDISQIHDAATEFASIDEARAKEEAPVAPPVDAGLPVEPTTSRPR